MTVKAAVFNGKYLLAVVTLADVPRRQDYIQVPGQTYIGCVAEYVVLLDTNRDGWDILIVIGSHYVQHPTPAEVKYAIQQRNLETYERRQRILKLKAIAANPDEVWARRKFAFEMSMTQRPRREIAAEMGISVGRVSELARLWRELLEDISTNGSQGEPSDAD